jgi:sensor histidine kinase regulating citrate/malate metabolism
MDKLVTDTLLKPDMLAVLSRTHLQINLHDFLLPIFEAISNAMHGIEEAFLDRAHAEKEGVITVRFKDWTNPKKIVVSVSDNGAGLTEENYRSFKTPFSGYKLRQKGRGFGRFIGFKIFARVVYQSRFSFLERATSGRFVLTSRRRKNSFS